MDPTPAPESLLVADSLAGLKALDEQVTVSLSNELVKLLSEQLYQSPLKAIEELVVNAYDADARECRVFVSTSPSSSFVLVFDDGIGMSDSGLADLWQIGSSNKRTPEVELRAKRKQIGKFGIGKLATYTIADTLTYISKSDKGILSVSVDFNDFLSSPSGSQPVQIPVHKIEDWQSFIETPHVKHVFDEAKIDASKLASGETWTIALLESLKDKAAEMSLKDLRWILRTAMPLRADFSLTLNGETITSSKEDYEVYASFRLAEIPDERFEQLSKKKGELRWKLDGDKLVSDSFPSGVSGDVLVTERSLLGKSDDLERSHGFFVYVRGRLINEGDALFGLNPLVHGIFNRFRADIHADDLDEVLKASRETIEESTLKNHFRVVLREIFNEAAGRYQEATKPPSERGRREGDTRTVPSYLVDLPVADALVAGRGQFGGAEADNSWFYLKATDQTSLANLIQRLYTEPQKYKYNYVQRGATERLVEFDASTSTFWLNEDHELVQEYVTVEQAQTLLEDFVTAETLLEIYLRETNLPLI